MALENRILNAVYLILIAVIGTILGNCVYAFLPPDIANRLSSFLFEVISLRLVFIVLFVLISFYIFFKIVQEPSHSSLWGDYDTKQFLKGSKINERENGGKFNAKKGMRREGIPKRSYRGR